MDRMIKQLLNSVIAKYRDLSVSETKISQNIAKYRDLSVSVTNHDILHNLVQLLLNVYLTFSNKGLNLSANSHSRA